MSDPNIPQGTCCCTPPSPGLRKLTFPDGTQAGVFGLDEILAAVYSEGMPVSAETAREIVERLAMKNYIAPSVRQQYGDLVIQEYGKYAKSQTDNSRRQEPALRSLPAADRKTGLLSRFFRVRRSGRREERQ
jgi:hypothetical protein